MLTFAEEITLLLLDDDSGEIAPVEPNTLRLTMSGAVLMDLALRGRIDTDLEKLVLVDPSPTGEKVLDESLAEIAAAGEVHDAGHWVLNIADRGYAILDWALERLVERKILKFVEKKILWVVARRRYPTVDNAEEREVKLRLIDVLLSDTLPDPRDVALICLVDACAILPLILSKREIDNATPRLEQLRKMDLIGLAMSSAVSEVQAQVAAACARWA